MWKSSSNWRVQHKYRCSMFPTSARANINSVCQLKFRNASMLYPSLFDRLGFWYSRVTRFGFRSAHWNQNSWLFIWWKISMSFSLSDIFLMHFSQPSPCLHNVHVTSRSLSPVNSISSSCNFRVFWAHWLRNWNPAGILSPRQLQSVRIVISLFSTLGRWWSNHLYPGHMVRKVQFLCHIRSPGPVLFRELRTLFHPTSVLG